MDLIPDLRALPERLYVKLSEVFKLESDQDGTGNIILLELLNDGWLEASVIHPSCNLSWCP
jgi:hypothetical protein